MSVSVTCVGELFRQSRYRPKSLSPPPSCLVTGHLAGVEGVVGGQGREDPAGISAAAVVVRSSSSRCPPVPRLPDPRPPPRCRKGSLSSPAPTISRR